MAKTLENVVICSEMLQKIILTCLLCLIYGCASNGPVPVYFDMPATRMESPVVSGKSFKGGVGIAFDSFIRFNTTQDISSPNQPKAKVEVPVQDNLFDMQFALGLSKRLEITNLVDLYAIKWQFLGGTRADPNSNEWVASVTLGGVPFDRARFRRVDDEHPENNARAELRRQGYSAGILTGYRLRHALFYLNTTDLFLESTTRIENATGIASKRYHANQFSANIGYRIDLRNFFICLENAVTVNTIGNDSLNYSPFGLALGFQW